jgi:hypothetical protein
MSVLTSPMPGTRSPESPAGRLSVRSTLAAVVVLVLAGCVSQPVPIAQMAIAESSVKRADTSNTRVSAPGELKIAIAKLASAQQAAARREYVLAGQLAEQAEVDAQVAMLHAERVRAQKSAQESLDAANALREESQRQNR